MNGRRKCYYCETEMEPGEDYRWWYCSEECFLRSYARKREAVKKAISRLGGDNGTSKKD